MAIILADGSRPVLSLDGDNLRSEAAAGVWGERLAAADEHVTRAIRAVARIETPGWLSPFIGTAFMVAPRLAVTASYVGEALIQRGRDLPAGTPVAWLDFSTTPAEASNRIAVNQVHLVHPYWGAAFLGIAAAISDRVLTLAPPTMAHEIADREICVIGYPASDSRSEQSVTDLLFGGEFGIKRVMPGLARGIRMATEIEGSPRIEHDATTLGGTAGAPLIDLATGTVVGLQYAGAYLKSNYAAPAWQLNRDPQWARLFDGTIDTPVLSAGEIARRAVGAATQTRDARVFKHEEIQALSQLLAGPGKFATTKDITVLLAGLPPELIGALPEPDNPGARLFGCLSALNDMMFLVDDQVPIYRVLTNARFIRDWNPGLKAKLKPYIDAAAACHDEAAAAGG